MRWNYEQTHKNTVAPGTNQPRWVCDVEARLAAQCPSVTGFVESRRPAIEAPDSLARCPAVVWRGKCVFIAPCGRFPINCMHLCFISFNRDDTDLDRTSDQDEISFARPMVWLLLRTNQLDRRFRRIPSLGALPFLKAEHSAQT